MNPLQAPLPPVPPPRWRRRLLPSLLLAALLAGLGVAGYSYWRAQQLLDQLQAGPKKQVIQQVQPELGVAPAQPGIDHQLTFLLVGADHRQVDGPGDRGRSDTMLLARLDPQQGLSLLSIPRDWRVEIPGYGLRKVNDAYALGGAGLLTRTLREQLGVQIDHYAEITFGGFQELVNQLGGIYVPVDGRYYHRTGPGADNWSSIDLLPGYQRLPGSKALEFARFRHYDDDFVRAARQQLFLRELGRQLQATVDFSRLPGLMDTVFSATTSDLHSVVQAARIARTLYDVRGEHINRVTLQGQDQWIGGGSYLIASPEDVRRSLWAWAHPQQREQRHRLPRSRPQRPPAPVALIDDGGQGRQLLRTLGGPARQLQLCAPTRLLPGYGWGTQVPARAYRLGRYPAVAAWMSAGSGRSLLWMYTSWGNPPILHAPSESRRVGRRRYQLYWESGRLRTLAWRQGNTRIWLTNTLQNRLSTREMLALARSCAAL